MEKRDPASAFPAKSSLIKKKRPGVRTTFVLNDIHEEVECDGIVPLWHLFQGQDRDPSGMVKVDPRQCKLSLLAIVLENPLAAVNSFMILQNPV